MLCFLNKNETMENVKKHSNCIYHYKHWEIIYIFHVLIVFVYFDCTEIWPSLKLGRNGNKWARPWSGAIVPLKFYMHFRKKWLSLNKQPGEIVLLVIFRDSVSCVILNYWREGKGKLAQIVFLLSECIGHQTVHYFVKLVIPGVYLMYAEFWWES
jgi:hypothetical protein